LSRDSAARRSAQERRARLGRRHHLAPACRAADVVDVARDVVGLHSTDAASVFISACARLREPSVAGLELALYQDRSLMRILGMRRTMFVVPVELAPVLHAACALPLAPRERRRNIQMVEEGGIATDGAAWLAEVEAATMAALEAQGEATGSELAAAVPALREKIRFGEGKKWEGLVGMTTRVLFLLATEGRAVRGRPRGTWISTQYRWAPMDAWVAGGIHELPREVAQRELAARWLGAFGPGSAADLRWWTGWTAAETHRALLAVEAVEVVIDSGRGLVLPGDEPEPPLEPFAALLPALDPTVMGWSERDWFLGEHGPVLFDRSGNAGPTVWWDGRVVGGWAQRRSGEVAYRLLEDVGREAVLAIETEAARLASWIGDVRVTPRFRTPLERELSV
jgi:hypothetical protein